MPSKSPRESRQWWENLSSREHEITFCRERVSELTLRRVWREMRLKEENIRSFSSVGRERLGWLGIGKTPCGKTGVQVA